MTTTLLMPLVVGLLVLLWPSAHNNTMQNRIASSELMTQDEVVYGQWLGINGHAFQLTTDSTWSIGCAFITAACVNGGSTGGYASAYYNNSACSFHSAAPSLLFSGVMAAADFEGWWGSATFTPFTSCSLPSMADETTFILGLAGIMASNYGIVCHDTYGNNSEGHIWAILRIKLKENGGDDPKCNFEIINAEYQTDDAFIERNKSYSDLMNYFIDVSTAHLCQ